MGQYYLKHDIKIEEARNLLKDLKAKKITKPKTENEFNVSNLFVICKTNTKLVDIKYCPHLDYYFNYGDKKIPDNYIEWYYLDNGWEIIKKN